MRQIKYRQHKSTQNNQGQLNKYKEFCLVHFVWYILSWYILSLVHFVFGTFCLVHFVWYILSGYILSGTFCLVHFVLVHFVIEPSGLLDWNKRFIRDY